MHEIIREGKAAIRIKKAIKVSKEMEVFYNPAMKLNRDITILLLQQFPKMSLCDPLAASGIRSIRFARELKYKSISINDMDARAVNSIKNNLRLNKINMFSIIKNPINNFDNDKKTTIKRKIGIKKNKILVYNEDANLFLLNSSGFDYIDIDPFGSSNSYLDAAVKRISRSGILAVTNTDTAALAGTYPNACIRKYWARARRDYLMHETGLRILIRKVQLIGMQYEKALFPIFSYFKEHYFRVFFQCIKGKKLCDEIAKQHGMLNDCGPLWLGDLWDSKLVDKMYGTLLKNSSEKIGALDKSDIDKNNKKYCNNKNSIDKSNISNNLIKNKINNEKIINDNQNNELIRFLKIIKEESKINAAGFYDLHNIAEKMRFKATMKKDEAIKEIKKRGFKAAETHFSGTGIRTDIKLEELIKIMGQV